MVFAEVEPFQADELAEELLDLEGFDSIEDSEWITLTVET